MLIMSDLKICRVCLITDVRGYKLGEHSLRDYYEHVMRQRINPKDGLPQWVCYECASMLHKFHKFKEKCYRGQLTLKRITWNRAITFDAVSAVNRYSENLVSSIGVMVVSKRVKTSFHKHKRLVQPKIIELEKVLLSQDSDDDLKQEQIPITNKILHKQDKEAKRDVKVAVAEVEIKTEIPLPPVPLKAEEDIPKLDADMGNDISNNYAEPNVPNITNHIDTNDINDMETDHIDNAMSSDDENIFLDIVKKAHKGENKLVFLDGIEIAPKAKKKKKHIEGKIQKFARPKKEYLNPQYWRKFNLSEEDALHEFKQREHSEKYVNANYKCHNCFKGFSKVEMLLRHVKSRHDESLGLIECRFCHMRFRRKFQLCRHVKQHYTVYHCLRCDMRFRLENSAIFHEDYHSGVIRKCKYCGEEFKHSSTYYTHLRMAHRSAHLCTHCGASFVSEAGLRQHKRIKHVDNSDEAPDEPPASDTYCEKCDIKFTSRAAYDEHLTHSNMHGDLTQETDVGRRNLKGNRIAPPVGMRIMRKTKPTTCQYCGKHFATQASCMKHHYAEHPRRSFYPPDKRHICEVCGASLASVSITSHMNRHTREHVYPCAICGMQFISKSSHHRHQVTHTGERPYPCPLCEKRFTQKNSMQLHYRTFHLKQPYPKRNRRKKTDEMPIMECPITRDRSDIDSNDTPPAARWRPAL